ncbi:MAG: chromosome partitioning protein [Bacteroidetes bacterium QS_8_68_15]|nr:MAG: chromosome partitioning protein [Bacteroidetes bacterium QS_8_68_15]
MEPSSSSIQVVPVINNKGGVGKTTTAINLAGGLSRAGKRVLLVDLDSQGSASLALGVTRGEQRPSSADVLFGEAPSEAATRRLDGPGFDLMPGSIELADTDVRLAQVQRRERRLDTVLRPLRSEYDVILLDCPPSTSLLAVNVVIAADAFLIPLLPSYLGLEGIVSLGEVISKARQNLGYVAPVLGILLTLVDHDKEGTEEIIGQVRNHYGDKVFDTEIGPDVSLEDAPGYKQTVFEFDDDSQGARDYAALTQEVIERLRAHDDSSASSDEEAPDAQQAPTAGGIAAGPAK